MQHSLQYKIIKRALAFFLKNKIYYSPKTVNGEREAVKDTYMGFKNPHSTTLSMTEQASFFWRVFVFREKDGAIQAFSHEVVAYYRI
ncbi:hypothetical protein HCUR_01169 [Holospora curviuscula]|uniref:Uncharacterized protein n=1 Tax=Holospora curviuscula TaxID=1082868 RepID=A0A2S5R8B5_9PROT|nr:hypothetical protein HCUR_01169 [Holospora curviuscula]